ncbi:GCN5 family acetyltransferase [Streptomyces sp. NRRL F-4489]|uniref:GNAT family N-acetyltransferase n=1 Tax=Streptomyces sp. NRRL F-4489 TaxID=1609095 RepID=UPI0007484995|nr:GNAT family N-acetyltransferase [Streptomyces sp. NRRL F-4489]KUL38691.1 GCN5 family acetyltransferase [Streptomyces sp. NRRL F-4489]
MRPTPTTTGTGQLTVAAAPLDHWDEIVGWTADEGWNPGDGDIALFHPTDPGGFFTGRLGDRTVSAVSVVNHSADYAFLGFYLVAPDLRGQGLGLATWRAAVPHAGARTIGLDGVPAQVDTYRRAGFRPAHDTLRYTGRPTPGGPLSPDVHPVTAAHLDAIAAYDRRCFPADRRDFVARWLTAPGRTARVHLRDGEVTGYGVLRPAHEGHRIGPLFADTPATAEALFDALTAELDPAAEVSLDIPEPRSDALALAASRGLTPRSHTVRMYTGPVPPADPARTFGVTSLELG